MAVSINDFAVSRYDVLNAGTGADVRTAGVDVGSTYTFNSPGRQPAAIAANQRIIDTLDDRIGSSVYEYDGKLYGVHTITPVGQDETRVRYYVIDQATNAVLDEGEIGEAGYDYYQGSLAVNRLGQVVIGYNRSGLNPTDGRITLLARVFHTQADGTLVQKGSEHVLKVSLTDDYHNGSIFGQPAAGRQRWQDYSSVSLDPLDPHGFWVQGGFAREYNLPQFGHPNGTGGSRWGTYIAGLSVGGVPEPQTWAMFILGFGLIGASVRRRRPAVVVS
ncbi:PEPxxWA-CTERM sorting domain-containing protein [Sandaracinobacteroides saxicola]|uniref:PEPxxWA-CTERM sorting domain-containing protein n=1 Tax=Sandaracinobacteroides saxicola TaxID=2759707 RepID=A0A7G5IMY9_9SPHN|nr:PEPxxWA-CTERM sorting domain-containing protein [Sandaracinobacteroides saxicola]